MTAIARTIVQGGRAKAYRPLPVRQRRRAIRAGLEAYARGEFFEAHELLEPAWMGTRDVAERDALQGLIKLAAAYVHAVRGNPLGVAKNLDGAAERLHRAVDAGLRRLGEIDVVALAAEVDRRRSAVRSLDALEVDRTRLVAALPPPILAADR